MPSVILTEVCPLVTSVPPILTTSYCVAVKVGMNEVVVTEVGTTRTMFLLAASMTPTMSAGRVLLRLWVSEKEVSSHFPSGVSFGCQETRTEMAARVQARIEINFFMIRLFKVV